MNKKWISFNPLHCGAVVASRRAVARRWAGAHVSIPFIAGQWSLHGGARGENERQKESFNPLHCGAVVASFPFPLPEIPSGVFQSPSLRGSGRFSFYGGISFMT